MGIIKGIKSRIIRFFYRKVAAGIRQTAPVSNFDEQSNLIVLSMVQHSDVDMLLVAIKSFVRFVRVRQFVIVADPSLTDHDKALLLGHLVKVRFIAADEIAEKDFPRGGTWERLLSIASINQDGYVIQLDADTITNSNPVQVINAVSAGYSFTLGTKVHEIKTLQAAESFAKNIIKQRNENHIQIVCEAMLTQLSDSFTHYVRGCSGFAGFSQGALSIDDLRIANDFFYQKLGERWEEWGTEQFTSNLMIANMDNAEVLELDRYDVPNKKNTGKLSFHHYIGSMRFYNTLYLFNTLRLIRSLNK